MHQGIKSHQGASWAEGGDRGLAPTRSSQLKTFDSVLKNKKRIKIKIKLINQLLNPPKLVTRLNLPTDFFDCTD